MDGERRQSAVMLDVFQHPSSAVWRGNTTYKGVLPPLNAALMDAETSSA
jgi:hypothetical protein